MSSRVDWIRPEKSGYCLTSLLVHSGWKALVPHVMISVLFTSRTRM